MNDRRGHPVEGKPPDSWRVFFALEPQEADQIVAVAHDVIPPERLSVHRDPSGELLAAEVTLSIVVAGGTADQALHEASRLYGRIQEQADIPVRRPHVLGLIGPAKPSRADHLMAEASNLLIDDRKEMAVVAMQIACELHAEEVIGDLAEAAGLTRKLLRRRLTLQDHAMRAILELLTGKRIQDEPWWDGFVEHVQRRNAVVHDGIMVPTDQAERSGKPATAFQEYIAGLKR